MENCLCLAVRDISFWADQRKVKKMRKAIICLVLVGCSYPTYTTVDQIAAPSIGDSVADGGIIRAVDGGTSFSGFLGGGKGEVFPAIIEDAGKIMSGIDGGGGSGYDSGVEGGSEDEAGSTGDEGEAGIGDDGSDDTGSQPDVMAIEAGDDSGTEDSGGGLYYNDAGSCIPGTDICTCSDLESEMVNGWILCSSMGGDSESCATEQFSQCTDLTIEYMPQCKSTCIAFANQY